MRTTRFRLGLACAGASLLLALPCAQAQSLAVGPYVGFGVGQARAGDMNSGAINQALQGQGLVVRTESVDDSAAGWKVYGGYRINQSVAVEGAYAFLGKYDFRGQVIADPGTVQASFKADDWNVSVLGSIPLLTSLHVFGKLGLGYWRAQLDASGAFGGSAAHGVTSHGVGAIAGLGALLPLSPTLSARIEWERFFKVGKASGSGRADIDLFTAGLQYSF